MSAYEPKEGKNGLRIVCNSECKFNAGVPRPYSAPDCTYDKGSNYYKPVLCPPACEEHIKAYYDGHRQDEGELKLYYWGYKSIYQCCVLARSVEHARVVLMKNMLSSLNPSDNNHYIKEMLTRYDPAVVEGKVVVWCHGGDAI